MTEQGHQRKPSAKLSSSDQESSVLLRLEEVGSDDYPSRRLAVEATFGAHFRGRYDQVWVERSMFDRFLVDLAALERTRRGDASLEGMSPGDFFLHLRTIDSIGHVVVTVAL